MNVAPRSVLIVRLSSIGDVVHTIPAYMALRRSWPEAEFGWAVEAAAADLVRRLPGGIRVHELQLQRWRRSLLSAATRRAVRGRIAELRDVGYELAVDFQGLVKSALVARSARARVLGFAPGDVREAMATRLYHEHAAPSDPGCHIVRHNLHLAKVAGAADDAIEYPLLCDDDDQRFADETVSLLGSNRFAILHTAANWPSKRYEAANFVSVARQLHERSSLEILWIWGPGERARTEQLVLQAGTGNRLAPATTLPQLVALLRRAKLFVGGDSAPLHLAVACATPSVALFGPTDPARLGPLDVADQVVCQRLPCSHCHRRHCPLGTLECLVSVSPATIVDAAMTRLERAGTAVTG